MQSSTSNLLSSSKLLRGIFIATLGLVTATNARTNAALVTGQPHSTVQTLTSETFHQAIEDPANGIWILKFYSPRCVHCKKLTPILDKMAPHLKGKSAIGKIDCTTSSEKPLCEKFKVRGYPTIKVYRDGSFFDYSGKRDPDSMIEFVEQLSQPSVMLVETYEEFLEKVLKTSSTPGVAFMAYDPNAKIIEDSGRDLATPAERYLASTQSLQVFGQVSRKLQDRASFGMLKPFPMSMTEQEQRKELFKFGITMDDNKTPFLIKIEEHVDSVFYKGDMSSSVDFMTFVKLHNIPLVSTLEGHNFRNVAHLGKPLFIGVLDSESSDTAISKYVSSKLREKAIANTIAGGGTEKYIFAVMDGTKFSKFLSQFSIIPGNLPQFLILDAPKRLYYQNETMKDIDDFINGINNGTIVQKEQSTNSKQGGLEGMLVVVHDFFVKYLPYSMLVVVFIFCLILWCTLSEDEEDIRCYEQLRLQEKALKQREQEKKEKAIKED